MGSVKSNNKNLISQVTLRVYTELFTYFVLGIVFMTSTIEIRIQQQNNVALHALKLHLALLKSYFIESFIKQTGYFAVKR